MKKVYTSSVAVTLGALLAVACIGPGESAGGACEEFGGVCVAAASQCGGTLPYQCNSGTCCQTELPAVPDASVTTLPFADATVTKVDATVPHDGGADAAANDVVISTPDTGAPDTSPPPADAAPPSDASTGDTSPPIDAGREASLPDAHGEDVHLDDAKSEDAHEDVKHDTGAHDSGKDSAVLCNDYASPTEPSTACNRGGNPCIFNSDCPSNDCSEDGTCTALCPSDPNCQPNSCLNGDWCHIATGNCVKPSAVLCDAGS